MRLLILQAAAVWGLAAGDFHQAAIHQFAGERVQGAAWQPGQRTLFTWGDRVVAWTLPGGVSRVIVPAGALGFQEGGCLVDVDGDGVQDLVLQEAPKAGTALGRMVWLRMPRGPLREIDTESDFHDCLETTLHGRRGLLVIHRQAQVRFYEFAGGRWSYREIYSIYTPSRQGGLLVQDIDADGLPDILCGNYWIRSPAAFDLPWRLFAINNWWDQTDSAMLRLAWNGSLIAAQRESSPARMARFDRPTDPAQLWTARPTSAEPPLHRVQALAAAGSMVVAGENHGAGSRLLLLESGKKPELLGISRGFLHVWIVDLDGDGLSDILAAGRDSIESWKNQRRK